MSFVSVKREQKVGRNLERREWLFHFSQDPTSVSIELNAILLTTFDAKGKKKATVTEWEWGRAVKGKLPAQPPVPADVGQEGVNKLVGKITVGFKTKGK